MILEISREGSNATGDALVHQERAREQAFKYSTHTLNLMIS